MKQNSTILKIPKNATFAEAAAILFGGQTAIYFLGKAKIDSRTNQSILIIGGTGAVGTAAIQIAKYYQANITVVCSSEGQVLASELGASNTILYDQEDLIN
nr:hypothetical protein [uncultured Flavobacterium sp.]